MNINEKLIRVFNAVKSKIPFKPEIALVLGSGLGSFADDLEVASVIDYRDIDGFPESTVDGHKGRFVFAKIADKPCVIMQGRIHYYEGYPMSDVVLPVRIMCMLGAKILFLTNAAGGIGKTFGAGDFMLITDHISQFVPSPLIGENVDFAGARFPDMTNVYDKDLSDCITAAAESENILLKKGVYCQLTGPNYETPSEIAMLKILGADAVGMSTAVEAIAAKHFGVKVCGISLISNLAAGVSPKPLTHAEVKKAGDKAAQTFKRLVMKSIGLFVSRGLA